MNEKDKLTIKNCLKRANVMDELSESTVLKYASSIKRFFSVMTELEIDSLAVENFEEFIYRMKIEGVKNRRIANVISSIKWLLVSLKNQGKLKNKIELDSIPFPKIKKNQSVEYLTEEEIDIFLKTIQADINNSPCLKNIRFMTLVMFLLYTGARIGETLSINIEDLDKINNCVKVVGKGNKERKLNIKRFVFYWIERYLAKRNDNHKALFITLNGESRWKQTDVGRSFRRFRDKSGINKKISAHILRHSYATHLIKRGVGVNIVQRSLGHSSPDITFEHYVGSVEEQEVKKYLTDEMFDFIPSDEITKD